ncbi:MAG TPA: PQQ-binding-like beta-propeller repeat protein, partial [Humisphaera sp.]
QDWPSFYGTLSALRGPDYGKPIVDDLNKARPLWRSEANCLSGWGTGADSRYRTRAAYGTLCGGSSSPVVAGGLVYLYHYRPSGDVEPAGPDAEVLAKFKDNPHEFDAIRRWYSKRADVVVSCVDGATGRTVWESVWSAKQGNYQTHKWRGNNHTPTVAKGVLVVSDYSWGLHAHDAKTGQLKWTRGGGGDVPHDQGAVGPVVSGDVVVWATKAGTFGLDLATGKELWKAPAAGSARRMVIDGAERVLLVGEALVLIDPADGKEIARTPFPGGIENKGKRDIGRGAGSNLVCDGPYVVSFETVAPPAGTKDKAGKPVKSVGTVFALKVEGNAIRPAWRHEAAAAMEDGHIGLCIAKGHVYTAFQTDGAYCIDLATGRTAKHLPGANANSNPIFAAVDDRIFWQPECQHGKQHVTLFDANPAAFGPLGGEWTPPHNDTTAYGEMPTANVVVDGRLIIRGMDGLYCYDLRKR